MKNLNLHPKVQAGGVGGAIVVLISAVLSSAGVTLPAAVASSLATLLSFAAGYWA